MQLKLKFFMTLALLLTTMTAGAQYSYTLTLNDNYEGGGSQIIPNIESGATISLISGWTPTRAGHTFFGWSELSSGTATHAVGSSISITKDLTLYGIWEDTPLYSLKYTITSESQRMAQLTGYLGNKPTGALVIPASVTIGGNSYAVTSIGVDAFNSCPGLTSVTFAAGSQLASIGNSAFGYCGGLTSVTIPDGVTSIGDNAFVNCANLTSVTLNSNPAIGDDAFPAGATVTMNLTANTAEGAKWMTFYNKNYNFQADENTQVFKAELSGTTITLYEVMDKIVNASTGVVLKTTGDGNPVMTLTTTESIDTQTNSLIGVADIEGVTSDGTYYVLNYKESTGVGFYKLTNGKKLGLGKAYLQTTSGSNFFGMEEETTSISGEFRVESGEFATAEGYYDLSGRKVTNPKKGIFIHNGRKEVVK